MIGDNDQIVIDDGDSASISNWVEERQPDPSIFDKIKSFFKGGPKTNDIAKDAETAAGMDGLQQLNLSPIAQHYHPDRSLIYDQVRTTRETNLTVAVEQVSIFLTTDGTVITFFQVLHWMIMINYSNLGERLRNLLLKGFPRRVLFFGHRKTLRYYSKVSSMPLLIYHSQSLQHIKNSLLIWYVN